MYNMSISTYMCASLRSRSTRRSSSHAAVRFMATKISVESVGFESSTLVSASNLPRDRLLDMFSLILHVVDRLCRYDMIYSIV